MKYLDEKNGDNLMQELLYQIWLGCLDGISVTKIHRLYDEFGSFRAIYEANGIEFKNIERISSEDIRMISNKNLDRANKIIEDCNNLGIDIISYYDERYPKRLKQISGAPAQLYVKGKLPPIDEVCVIAIVGARRSSLYGNNTANLLAHDLGRAGAVVISGMARGIDTSAHRGALKSESDTIAVLGCGVDVVYPPENVELKRIIEGHGAVISEYPPGTPPTPSNFPARNRIISGLSVATVIVEGKVTSGSTITARLALEQGREVFCIPGNIDSPLSQGPNMLIRDGARLATCAKDIIIDLTADYPELMVETILGEDAQNKIMDKKILKLPNDQKRILEVLKANHPMHIDEICHITGVEVAVANQCLFMLEMNSLVKPLPGKQYILRND